MKETPLSKCEHGVYYKAGHFNMEPNVSDNVARYITRPPRDKENECDDSSTSETAELKEALKLSKIFVREYKKALLWGALGGASSASVLWWLLWLFR